MKFMAAAVATAAASLLLGASIAEARTFDFKNERFASYFGGTYGASAVGDNAYGNSSGNGVTVDRRSAANASGELGFVISSPRANVRLGVEALFPRNYDDITGSDASGTALFTLKSKVMAFIPQAALEILFRPTAESRIIVGAGGGLAIVTLDNEYTMTSSGTTALGVGDFVESASARVGMGRAYVGYEFLFTDTVTLAAELGYRHLVVPSLKSTRNSTAISGTQSEGGDVLNMDGKPRSLDLGGAYAGVTFRFYIGL